jgi:hypothetical protein
LCLSVCVTVMMSVCFVTSASRSHDTNRVCVS